ncbi:putative retrotransposon gag domain-containing protein [Helianthus annuus]|nr:putative retrotransposon gag domain-containing protein [Helianthus annuus]
MRKRYFSRAEVQKLESELWNLKMEGSEIEISEYVQRFHELSQVASHLVEPEFKKIERFIGGSSKPPTITDAID